MSYELESTAREVRCVTSRPGPRNRHLSELVRLGPEFGGVLMRANRAIIGLVLVVLVGVGCAPTAPGATSGAPAAVVGGQPKRIAIAVQQEAKPDVGTVPVPTAEEFWQDYLTVSDHIGNVIPHLTSELPAQDRGTWTVAPDGSMTTTYKLRPNIYWHDGTALSARDFAFSWKVGSDKALPIQNRAVTRLI